jgi:hypothetical protein
VRAPWIVVFAASLVFAPGALANGDPASDVLLQAKIYFPTQRVGVPQAQQLHRVVQAANTKGYTIRVALIHDENDLGTVPNLLNQPQKYAEFLAPEIRFAYRGDLLVVMPDGLGVTQTDQTPAPAKAIDGMKVEAGGSPEGLALTAEEAVAKLSAAAGHPLEGAKKGGSSSALAGILVAVALLGLGIGGALWLRHSQRPVAAASDSPGDS